MENPELDYYHLRGVVYKWPVFFAKKSIFPWTVLWVLRRMGRNKVHKNAMFGDMYPGLESAHAEDGTIIMDGSSVSSHVVDAIFGSLSIFEVDLSKNSTIHANTIVGPGSDVEADLSIGPRVLLPKKWENKVENSHFVWGNPVPASKRNSRGNLMDLIPKSFKKSHPIYDPQKKI